VGLADVPERRLVGTRLPVSQAPWETIRRRRVCAYPGMQSRGLPAQGARHTSCSYLGA
jgi:hypothetical protein